MTVSRRRPSPGRCRRSASRCRCPMARGTCWPGSGPTARRCRWLRPRPPGPHLHKKVAAGPKLYAFTTGGYDSPVITAELRLRLSKQGNFNRRVLRRALYPIQSAAPAAGTRCPVRELERQAVRRQPPRHRPRAPPPWGRPRAHLGGDRLRGRGPRRRPGGAVGDRGVLRRARPLPVRDLQRRHAAVLPQARGPGLPADLARDPAEKLASTSAARSSRAAPPTSTAWRPTSASGTCCCRRTRSAPRSSGVRSGTRARSASTGTRVTTSLTRGGPLAGHLCAGGYPPRQAGGDVRPDLA